MAVIDDIRALILRRSGRPLCDGCIAKLLGLTGSQYANLKIRELLKDPGFTRDKGECSGCGRGKLVIRGS